ncbi:MAG: 50S ribosomal protein L10 [Bacteroidales bacterium]|nr:50S ribosomal protein L10 [Bacteroidales bacterium]
MKRREEKEEIVNHLIEDIKNTSHFYLADISGLNAEETTELRRKCFENDLRLTVVKNTLLKRALDAVEFSAEELEQALEGPTSLILTEKGNAPAKLIKEFRKKKDKPLLKGAYVEESLYIGDDKLEDLSKIKSKEELLGDLILQLQSPMNDVISSLKSGNDILAGVVKTLSEKEE